MRVMFGTAGRIALGAALMSAGMGVCAWGQTHKVAKPEQVVRAVGVYEWTGDISKPTASRLIPITVFIDGKLEDAGEYLARPVPFALLTGNLYELQIAGIPKANLELRYAKHLQAVDTATGANLFDNGWFGYGVYHALAPPKKAPALVATRNMPQITTSKSDDGKPHFSNTPSKGSDSKSASSDTGSGSGSSGSAGDPDRPTMRRRTGSGSDNGASTSGNSSGKSPNASVTEVGTPGDDPDRPRLTKRSGSDSDDQDANTNTTASASGSGQSGSGQSSSGGTDSSASKKTTTASGGSADDPDRPRLKRRTAEETKKQNQKEASASVTGVGSLNDDPDRPVMQHGKPANAMGESDLPKLTGLPADLHQRVAVSDATNREPHDFARAWEDDAERAAILTKMQALARAKIAEYTAAAGGNAAAPVAKTTTAAKASATSSAAAAAARRKAAAASAPAPVELQEEELKGFTLSYGGLPTYVYSAHTPGAGATLDFVTVVAQADVTGELKPAITNVTDAAHLDRTPRMRLVDVVDAEASNRASLLFELREAKSRQFGLYRVIGSKADQTFVTGSTE